MKRTKQERIRLGLLFVVIIAFFTVVAARLVQIQVFQAKKYGEIVDRQSTGKVAIPAERGVIYDRNGQLVAKNVFVSSLYAYPDNARELKAVAAYLEKIFNLPSGTARKKFGLRERKFRFIKRRLDESMARRIERDDVPSGLYIRKESQREYPFGRVGKQIIGFTDIDNQGQSGFELAYDSLLAGKEGWADFRRDGLRNTYRVNESALVKPVAGRSVVLTVDWSLQEIVEEELSAAVEKYHAKSAMAVFLDCNNGDILAMAHYDPEEKNPDKPSKLRAITDQFEPGSVFKAFTAAALLDAGAIDFNDSIFCEEGKWKIGRRTLHDDKKQGWLSFRKVVELSSNIGVAKCAIELGQDELIETYKRFGLGEKLRCGLPGETPGRLTAPRIESPYNIAALAMGHSVAVNTLQLAAGFGAIANGGELLRPRLLLGQVDDNGYVVRGNRRDLIGRAVMKESAVDSLKAFLRGVVENGTATPVNSPVIAIAGKTGTAEIPDLENHRYFKNKFIASFAGFFPCGNPIIAGAVVMEQPHPIHYGGYTSGPTLRKIAERYAVLNPDLFVDPGRVMAEKTKRLDNTVEVPNFVGRSIGQAVALAEKKGVKLRGTAQEGTVIWQFPPADRVLYDNDEVLVAVADERGRTTMVNLAGLPVRKAAALLDFTGIKFTITGNGRVVQQSIKPGETLTDNSVCRLTCRPG
ncbi:MAG: penicillin-binding transpeptidase domain-containing protein [Candidatus Zixiibacteriota bacterium]